MNNRKYGFEVVLPDAIPRKHSRNAVGAFFLGIIFLVSVYPAEAQATELYKEPVFQTLHVTNAEELNEALASAAGGETILLEGGDYGDFVLNKWYTDNVNFAETVTIKSANPDDPAVFNTAKVYGVTNLAFDGVTFDYTFSPEDTFDQSAFAFSENKNLIIQNCIFDGDIAKGLSDNQDGYPYGLGISIRDVEGVILENNEFFHFQRAMLLKNSEGIVVADNEFHSLRHDGINVVSVDGIVIEGNHFHDFIGRPGWDDHRDMIQFWTRNSDVPTKNVVIRDNILDVGEGSFTQSIFMRNEEVDSGRAGADMFYQNILITGNVILNAHLHGITVGETNGLRISNNTLVRNPRAAGWVYEPKRWTPNPKLWTPRIRVAGTSHNVTVTRNITSAIDGTAGQSDWVVFDNAFVQDHSRNMPGFYGRVFGVKALRDPTDVWAFQIAPEGPLAGRGIGAPRLAAPGRD